jgi:hypothetical protein
MNLKLFIENREKVEELSEYIRFQEFEQRSNIVDNLSDFLDFLMGINRVYNIYFEEEENN